MKKRNRRPLRAPEKGFTLIEMLVVFVIIAILAAIAIPTFIALRERGFRAQIVSALRNGGTVMQTRATENDGDYTLPSGVGPGAASDMLWLRDEGWRAAPEVTVDIIRATPTGFCMVGFHDLLDGETYEYSNIRGEPIPGNCS